MSEKLPKPYGNNRGRFAAAIISLVVGQAIAMSGTAFATRWIFSALHGDVIGTPIIALIGFVVSGLAYVGCRIGAVWVSEKLGQSYAIDFRRNFYMQLSRLPKRALAERRAGALAIRFVGDLSAMRNWVSKGLTGIVSAFIILPTAVFILWVLHPAYAVISAVLMGVALLFMMLFSLRFSALHRQLRKERANLSIDMMERAASAPLLRLFGRARSDFKLLRRRGDQLSAAATDRAFNLEVLKSIPMICMSVASIGLLWVTLHDGRSAAIAAAGLSIIGIMGMPLRDLALVIDMRNSWIIARDKSQIIFDMPVLKRTSNSDKFIAGPLEVSVENVSHGPINNMNFHAAPRERICLQGNQIAISLLQDMLTTLEDPETGCVRFNSIPVTEIHRTQLSKLVHLMTPSPPVLQGSLRRTLTLGCKPRPNDNTTMRLVNAYGLNNCLVRLGGLEGRVWEGGRNLSKSEIFKITLVRAALASPSLLIVDADGAYFCAETKSLLREFLKNLDATIVLSSTDPDLLEICTKTVTVNLDSLMRCPGQPGFGIGTGKSVA